jgi:uncharacterized protein (DUF1015 family)
MAKIKAFKALRPTRDKVHLVATRPYYSYKKNVLKAKMQSNPFSFLRIINPEFDLSKEDRNNGNMLDRFDLVKSKYEEFIADEVLFSDKEPSLYLYRQTHNDHEYTGIIAGASVDEYQRDLIKKHEATITSREEMFISYLDVVGYNAEPVLLSHEPSEELDELINQLCSERPEYEFTTTDYIKHELWCATGDDVQKIEDIFDKIPAAYIADGHHRSASSSGLNKNRLSRGIQFENQAYFLSFFIDETKLKIYEYNRLVKNVARLSSSEIIEALAEKFDVKKLEGPTKPIREHIMTMCLKGSWFQLSCKSKILNNNHPVGSLDAEILTQHVLSPILQIHDLKTDPNISFISGVESIDKMKKKMLKDGFDILFILYPVTMEQVKRVADNNLIMPPKSTWVEPKMRSGLTIYNINE